MKFGQISPSKATLTTLSLVEFYNFYLFAKDWKNVISSQKQKEREKHNEKQMSRVYMYNP